jgi:hypothetical protein
MVVCPGASGWELRVFAGAGERVVATAGEPGELAGQLGASAQVALPVSQVTMLPLWLATGERALLAGMLELQLERRGLLAARREETVRDYRVLRQAGGRTLVVASVLSREFPREWSIGKVGGYALSADYIVKPPNQILLWRELGRLALALVAEDELVYLQTLPGAPALAEVALELRCALLQLAAGKTGVNPTGITAWGEHDAALLEQLGREFALPVQLEPRLPLALPLTTRALLPNDARRQRQRQNQRRRNFRMLGGMGLLYLLGVLLVLGYLGRLWWQKRELERDLTLHREEVATIRHTALQWQALEPAIVPAAYPLEVLYRCTRALPEDGVRLVKFDQAGARVLLIGEAKNAPAAYKFADDLKNSQDLAGYTWEMQPPKLLPNNSAQFQIEGSSSHASANGQ